MSAPCWCDAVQAVQGKQKNVLQHGRPLPLQVTTELVMLRTICRAQPQAVHRACAVALLGHHGSRLGSHTTSSQTEATQQQIMRIRIHGCHVT